MRFSCVYGLVLLPSTQDEKEEEKKMFVILLYIWIH